MTVSGKGGMARIPTVRRALGHVPATTVITAVTALTGVVQFIHPALVLSWRRDPSALQSGQWWRLITPMLVQGSGVFQYAFNLAGSALVGPSVERRYGSRALVLLYLAGGIAGIAFGYSVHPHDFDSGSSDAVAALVGALCWTVLAQRQPARMPAAIYAIYFPVSLLALRLAGPAGATVTGAVIAAATVTLARRHATQSLTRLMLIAVPVPSLLLIVLLDSHGAGIAVGALLGAALSRGTTRALRSRARGDRGQVAG
jgi:membrane associated rhomboid family serine protease